MSKRNIQLTFVFFILFVLNNQPYAQNPAIKEIIWTTDWSPDGKYIAVGGNLDSLNIYSGKKIKPSKSFPIKNTITCVKWHPTKNIIAVATQLSEGKSCMINLDTDEKIELSGISPDGARGIDWNYSGEYLAVADNDGQISIFNIKGELVKAFRHENKLSITAIDWHPSKNILITVTDKIRIYDVEGNLLNSIKHRQEEVLLLCVAWHNSGKFFVTGDYGDTQNKSLLQYWDDKGKLLKAIELSKGEYRNVSWNRKGNRLASASDGLRIWDKEGNLVSEGKSKAFLWGVSWNKKGNRMITSSMEQEIILRDNKARIVLKIE